MNKNGVGSLAVYTIIKLLLEKRIHLHWLFLHIRSWKLKISSKMGQTVLKTWSGIGGYLNLNMLKICLKCHFPVVTKGYQRGHISLPTVPAESEHDFLLPLQHPHPRTILSHLLALNAICAYFPFSCFHFPLLCSPLPFPPFYLRAKWWILQGWGVSYERQYVMITVLGCQGSLDHAEFFRMVWCSYLIALLLVKLLFCHLRYSFKFRNKDGR